MGSSKPHSHNPRPKIKLFFSEFLAHFEAEGEIFLSHIVTANETWVMAWHHLQPLRKKVPRKFQTARRLLITAFWDCEEVTLLDSIPKGEAFNSDAYVRTLTEFWKLFKQIRAL
jgi:hypothetical protein